MSKNLGCSLYIRCTLSIEKYANLTHGVTRDPVRLCDLPSSLNLSLVIKRVELEADKSSVYVVHSQNVPTRAII
jgi:hypothetical protein